MVESAHLRESVPAIAGTNVRKEKRFDPHTRNVAFISKEADGRIIELSHIPLIQRRIVARDLPSADASDAVLTNGVHHVLDIVRIRKDRVLR